MTPEFSRRSVAAMLLCAAIAVPAAAEDDPTAPVAALDDGLLQVMRAGKQTPFATREQTLRPIVEQAFDLPLILRNSVGLRLTSFPEDQQEALLQTLTEFTVASYVANFATFSGERFDIAPAVRKSGQDDVVETTIVPTSGKPTRLDYVVRQVNGAYKIVDVLLDGSISRVAVQRSDFRSLLVTGDAQQLIAMLHSKSAALAAGNNE